MTYKQAIAKAMKELGYDDKAIAHFIRFLIRPESKFRSFELLDQDCSTSSAEQLQKGFILEKFKRDSRN